MSENGNKMLVPIEDGLRILMLAFLEDQGVVPEVAEARATDLMKCEVAFPATDSPTGEKIVEIELTKAEDLGNGRFKIHGVVGGVRVTVPAKLE